MSTSDELNLLDSLEENPDEQYRRLQERFPYRPTLFVGVGGTGCQAVSKIKTLFTSIWGTQAQETTEGRISPIPKGYAFRSFDTNIGERPANLQMKKEWLHCGVDDVPGFYKGIGSGEFYRSWVVKDYQDSSIMSGAGGYRNIGRWCLTYNITQVESLLREARDQIINWTHDRINNRPLVVVFCSLSGGTGSGFLLDTCFLLRTIFGNAAEIVGFLGLFDSMASTDPQKAQMMRAGTFAALKELNAFMEGRPEGIPWETPFQYALGGINSKYTYPMNWSYIFTSRKSDGQIALTTQNHTSSFMARFAFMISAYSFQDAMEDVAKTPDYSGVLDNSKDRLTLHPSGALCKYLVPGMVQLHFPIKSTANLFTFEAAIQYAKYQRGGAKPEGVEEARIFIKHQGLEHQALKEVLAKDPETDRKFPLLPQTFDEVLEELFKNRYENGKRILQYGERVPHLRAKEFRDRLSPNIAFHMTEVWKLVYAKTASFLVQKGMLALGAIDFLEDVHLVLREQYNTLDAINKEEVLCRFNLLQADWNDLKAPVEDVTTKSGAADGFMDGFKAPRAMAELISFANRADPVMLEKVINDIALEFYKNLLEKVDALKSDLERVFLKDLSDAVRIMEGRSLDIKTDLRHQAEGLDGDVANICSVNVMGQEWRKNYLEKADHLKPDRVLQALMDRGWHPMQLLTLKPSANEPLAKLLAQDLVNRVNQLTENERNLTPEEVLGQAGGGGQNSIEKLIAGMLRRHLSPQMQMTGMRNMIGIDPVQLAFCGGLTRQIKDRLKQSAEMPDVESLNVADNMESGRVNFFSCTVPVALAGCDLVTSVLQPAYMEWAKGQQRLGDKSKYNIALFHCFPNSYGWPDPTRLVSLMEEEEMFFARALAVSFLLEPSVDDKDRMNKAAKNPKEKLYGLFQVGRAQVWMWPFFEPGLKGADISGVLKNLGTSIEKAFYLVRDTPDLKEEARKWTQWFEQNWTQFFTAPQLEIQMAKCKDDFNRRKGLTQDLDQKNLWDRFISALKSWSLY